MTTVQGDAEVVTSGDAEPGADTEKLKWPLAKVYPWLEHIAAEDKEAVVTCSFTGDSYLLHATVGKVQHLLILAERV